MASIIDTSYFVGELQISGVQEPSVIASIQNIIDSSEDELLERLLGYTMLKAFKAEIATQRMKDILEGKEYTDRLLRTKKWQGIAFTVGAAKKSLIANYVYCKYIESKTTLTTGLGEKEYKMVQAVNADNALKFQRAWNEMVNWNLKLLDFLVNNFSTYPEFEAYYDGGVLSFVKDRELISVISKYNLF